MSREIVTSASAPKTVGPYSQAVKAGGFVFCSGQIPVHPATGELRTGSVAEATEQCLKNLQAVLAAAGSRLADAVQMTVYLTDMAGFAQMNEAYAKFFPSDPPARVTVAVAALPMGVPVEISCIARAATPTRAVRGDRK
jgi:2-iminobutanoate/2-iminopropanoate deaminase